MADAGRDEFLTRCMEEHFQSSGKLDKKRVLKAAGKVGLKVPSNCGPKGKGSFTQLAAFAELVAHEIFVQAKFATASTPGGGSAPSHSSTADPKRVLGYTGGGGSSRKRAKPRTGRKACEDASSTLFVIPACHDIPIWNHVHYRSEKSSTPRLPGSAGSMTG